MICKLHGDLLGPLLTQYHSDRGRTSPSFTHRSVYRPWRSECAALPCAHSACSLTHLSHPPPTLSSLTHLPLLQLNPEAKKTDSKTVKRLIEAMQENGEVGDMHVVHTPTAKSRTGSILGREIPVYLSPSSVRPYSLVVPVASSPESASRVTLWH